MASRGERTAMSEAENTSLQLPRRCRNERAMARPLPYHVVWFESEGVTGFQHQ